MYSIIIFGIVCRMLLATLFNLFLVNMNPGQVNDPGVSFASVYCLKFVTVHMPRATSRGGLPFVQHRVISFAEVTFHVNRTPKLSQGNSNFAHSRC